MCNHHRNQFESIFIPISCHKVSFTTPKVYTNYFIFLLPWENGEAENLLVIW